MDTVSYAPNTGPYEGLLFYQDRSLTYTSNNIFNGNSNSNTTGAFYFPTGPRGLGHWLSDYAGDGTFTGFKQYFDARGREDSFGYPKEEPRVRGGLWTQRFQAAVFEFHPENNRAGANAAGIPIRSYTVQLELLGDEYIAKYNLGLR